MASGSQPLAFAELAFGGLLLTSAITGETVGELLTNGLTEKGKARLHAKGEGANAEAPESLPEGSVPSNVIAPNAPAPSNVTIPNHLKHLQDLKVYLEHGLGFKEKLEYELGERKITSRQAEERFRRLYPDYGKVAGELNKALSK